jgi:hypothetical protein
VELGGDDGQSGLIAPGIRKIDHSPRLVYSGYSFGLEHLHFLHHRACSFMSLSGYIRQWHVCANGVKEDGRGLKRPAAPYFIL